MRREEKVQEVESLKAKLREFPVVAIADFTGVPADLLQNLRRELAGQAEIRVSKRTLIERALKEAGRPGLEQLVPYLRGQPALIFSRLNPFKLYRFLEARKRRVPAKPGSVSSSDVVVPAGEIDLPPGPAVSALQKMGAKARIQAGRVVLQEDFKLLAAGEVVSSEKSDLLAKLGILPVEQSLKITAATEGGLVYLPEVLRVDEKEISQRFQQAHLSAFNLSLSICFPTSQTIPVMVQKAHLSAVQLVLNLSFPVKDFMPLLLSKAATHMLALAAAVRGRNESALDEEIKALLG